MRGQLPITIPIRFLRRKNGPCEWLPFGGGIRRCIGMAFAQYEMKRVLGTALERPAFGRVREVRRGITIAPSNGLPVLLTRRTPRPSCKRHPSGVDAAGRLSDDIAQALQVEMPRRR